jgi:hypothetical protein
MKYIFIWYSFGILDVHICFYIIGKTLKFYFDQKLYASYFGIDEVPFILKFIDLYQYR